MRSFTLTPPWQRSVPAQSNGPTEGLYAPGLVFNITPGPLLQIVGLCGGAGATTLAYLTAATAARQSSAPVLVCDTGGPTVGLSVYAGVSSSRTLADTSERVAEGHALHREDLFTETSQGLRVIAGAPQFTVPGDPEGIRRVLRDACAVHGLTVIDGGTLSRPAEHAAMSMATHVAWILPANESAIERARHTLARIAPLGRPEFVIARADAGKPPMRALRALADERRAPLILMPRVTGSGGRQAKTGDAGLTLQAIGGLLRR
jgi:nucleotide-binding universal stress UspA family protein